MNTKKGEKMLDLSIAVDCWHSIANFTSVRSTTINECTFSKSAGFILLFFAVISFIINIHSLILIRKKRQISSPDRNLVTGMFLSSLCVILISVPSVVIQCLLCRRLCSRIICQIEGFNSFFNACLIIYMHVVLTIIRYSTTANSPLRNIRHLFKKYNLFLMVICVLMGSLWAVPPIFNRPSAYVPEGLGFHCGLNWFDRSLISRIYFLLLFIGVYFIPMIIIIYMNAHIHRTVYRLTHLNPIIPLEMNTISSQDLLRKHISDTLYFEERQRLHCLYEDRRFVRATSISLIIYLIAWIPYTIIVLAQLSGDRFSLYNPWLMTACALLAKLSMIMNPVIFAIVLKNRE